MSNKKLDPDEEISLESNMDIDDMSDLDDLGVDYDELSLGDEAPGNQVLQSTSKRVRMIFSVWQAQIELIY